MEDMNWKTWALIFIIAMGAGLEAIKRLPGTPSGLDLEKAGLLSGTPYNVKLKNAPMTLGGRPAGLPAPKAMVIGGQTISRETLEQFAAANKPEKTDFDHILKGMADKNKALAAKKKLKDGEEYEIFVDPKTGKRYKRKKKKSAKVEPKKVEEIAKVEPKKEEPANDEPKIEDLMAAALTTGQLPPAPNAPANQFADLEEWKKRLLTQPNVAETRTFIEQYKSSIVSTEIFYKITTMMVEDSRPQMKELGVLCAGSTPSVLSFSLLAEIYRTERSGSSIRNYADGFLAQYSNAANLGTLEQVMRSPTSNDVASLALKRLDAAAEKLLSPALNKQKSPGATSTTTATAHPNASYFQRFVVILQTMVRGTDATITSQAKTSLTSLQHLMNPNGLPAAPNAPPAQVQASADRW